MKKIIRNIMQLFLGFGTGNLVGNIMRYAFERGIASGVLSVISVILLVIGVGYFIIDNEEN